MIILLLLHLPDRKTRHVQPYAKLKREVTAKLKTEVTDSTFPPPPPRCWLRERASTEPQSVARPHHRIHLPSSPRLACCCDISLPYQHTPPSTSLLSIPHLLIPRNMPVGSVLVTGYVYTLQSTSSHLAVALRVEAYTYFHH